VAFNEAFHRRQHFAVIARLAMDDAIRMKTGDLSPAGIQFIAASLKDRTSCSLTILDNISSKERYRR
jgi:hypothetical protein